MPYLCPKCKHNEFKSFLAGEVSIIKDIHFLLECTYCKKVYDTNADNKLIEVVDGKDIIHNPNRR
jgi:hypothetical protein